MPTPTAAVTCPIPTGGADEVRAQPFFQEIPSVPRHSTRRFGSPPTTGRGHQSVRGRGGVIAVLYKAHWAGLSEPSLKREMNLQLSRTHILRYWAGTPDQHRQTNRICRRMCIGAAQSELSRNNGERFLAPGYACVPRAKWLHRYRDTVLPKGAHFGTRAMMGCRGLEKSARVRRRKEYTWSDFWTTRGRSGFLSPRHATQPQRGPYEVLGASRSTKPTRSLGGSNVM